MPRHCDDHAIVLAGYGFDEKGPYLSLNEVEDDEQRRYHVQGKLFSLRCHPQRLCVGRFDLETGAKTPCPLRVELLSDAKDDLCPACQEATGFNPSFYYADFVSPQQRAYNLTPHVVYLAYFAPGYMKAGITSAARGVRRLLEQGARAGRIVGRFDDAYQARELEAALCAQEGIAETMRASKKLDLLANVRYDAKEAVAALDDEAVRLARVEVVGAAGFDGRDLPQDLSRFYFGGPSPACADLQIPDGPADVCAGRCVGMVGGVLVLEQQGTNYLVSLKGWESHRIDLLEDELACTYDFAPQQMSLL
ncbi:MAG: DUF2797 domain-containing protein [Gordonibacter sp.]|uniref:DUF2797 domain-containing protein n=1 Tax=Gordonibacter sp. TaxID=1968902 RepID=UPI002FC82D04